MPHVRAACRAGRPDPDANPLPYERNGRAGIAGTAGGNRRTFERD